MNASTSFRAAHTVSRTHHLQGYNATCRSGQSDSRLAARSPAEEQRTRAAGQTAPNCQSVPQPPSPQAHEPLRLCGRLCLIRISQTRKSTRQSGSAVLCMHAVLTLVVCSTLRRYWMGSLGTLPMYPLWLSPPNHPHRLSLNLRRSCL